MNKDFFATFEDRKKAFAQRANIDGDVRAEVVLSTGRTFIIDALVASDETTVQLDAREISDEHTPLSIVLPYHQISFVQFLKPKPKGAAGFGR